MSHDPSLSIDAATFNTSPGGDTSHTSSTVILSGGSSWSQEDLGDAFDVKALSVIGELDPCGTNGVVMEVLTMFYQSTEPILAKVEHLCAANSATGIFAESQMLASAADQIGATRLAASCRSIARHFNGFAPAPSEPVDPELDVLVGNMMAEIVRAQRRLRRLLAP
jgi:hypothetical protein